MAARQRKDGNSYHWAVKYYFGQEKRWLKNVALKSDELMTEYLNLGQMEEVVRKLKGDISGKAYYIYPRFGRSLEATSTKTRNVFNM